MEAGRRFRISSKRGSNGGKHACADFALGVLACAGSAQGQSTADAFAPLIGCWRGTFENVADAYDERCFERLNAHVVDRHQVHPGAYAGETTYHDDDEGGIIFAYAASDGGRSNGAIRMEAGRFVIGAHSHRSADGGEIRLRGVWTLEAPDRLVMQSEREEAGAWRPLMRITYTRIGAED